MIGVNFGVRILSLIASSTEIVYALNQGKHLIGRSHECDYPAEVKKLPYCTRPRIDIHGSSREIDKRVKSALKAALSIYKVDEKKLKTLNPDIIITQSQCEVCAVSLLDVEKAIGSLVDNKPKIVSLEPNSIDDIWTDIEKVSDAIGVPLEGSALIKGMKNRIAQLQDLLKSKPARSVACIEWIDPLMAAGNWVPELVDLARGINIFGEKGKHSPWMTFNDLESENPDYIIIMPCGYDIKKTKREMHFLMSKKNWKNLKAVKNQNVYLTDGNQYFNRPGPRIVDSLEILIEILYDLKYDFGHFGLGWERL